MGSKFKAGDKVRCIDAEGFAEGALTEGEVYTIGSVKAHIREVVILENGYGFNWRRFELVEEPKPEVKTNPDTASIEFKYNGKVYQGVVQDAVKACKGCAFETQPCDSVNTASAKQTGFVCLDIDVIWVEKQTPKPAQKLNEQVIHCKNIQGSDGCSGSTWVFTESDKGPKYVDVQYAVCHHKDQYVKKVGVRLAKSKPKVTLLKGEVPKYIDSMANTNPKRWFNYPSMEQIYQAVIHLTK